jgi:flagellar protein FlbD
MIHVTRLHGAGSIIVNADMIETIEACPDTVITLVNKRRYVVMDSVEDVIERVIEFRQRAVSEPLGSRVAGKVLNDSGEKAA